MDIIVLLFVVILIVIDKNVRQRMFAALSAAVSLRHSIDTDSDMCDINDDTDVTAMSQRSDMYDKRNDNRDNHSDAHVKNMSQHSDKHVTRHVTRDKHSDKLVTSNVIDDTDNVTVSHEAIDAVSRLVAANVISASRACQIAFNVSTRGNTAIYRAVRERVAELKKMSNMSQQDEIIDIRSDGRVIRRDSDGKYYVIHSDGSKEYLAEEEVAK